MSNPYASAALRAIYSPPGTLTKSANPIRPTWDGLAAAAKSHVLRSALGGGALGALGGAGTAVVSNWNKYDDDPSRASVRDRLILGGLGGGALGAVGGAATAPSVMFNEALALEGKKPRFNILDNTFLWPALFGGRGDGNDQAAAIEAYLRARGR